MMSTITVDSSYVAAMKNKRFLLPLIKINIKHVKFEKLKEMLVNAVKKHFRNETAEEKAYAVSFLEFFGREESYRYSYLRAMSATGDILSGMDKFAKSDFSYLDGKVLVLIPEHDMFDKADSQKLVDIFTNPVVKESYGGHLGMVMRADLYIKEVEEFLIEKF